jgi:hypothetical protein
MQTNVHDGQIALPKMYSSPLTITFWKIVYLPSNAMLSSFDRRRNSSLGVLEKYELLKDVDQQNQHRAGNRQQNYVFSIQLKVISNFQQNSRTVLFKWPWDSNLYNYFSVEVRD